MKLRALCPFAAGLLVTAAAGACAADTADVSRGGRDGETVSGSAFAETVCTSLDRWVSSVQGKVQGIGTQIVASPREVKKRFSNLVRGLSLTTDELLRTVKEAGVPEVEGGPEFARDLTGAFRRARDVFAEIRAEVARLPEADPAAFRQQAAGIASSMQTALQTVMSEMGTARPDELRRAFENEPACAELVTTGF